MLHRFSAPLFGVVALLCASAASAQTAGFYILKDQSSPQQTLEMLLYSNSGGKSAPASISTDIFGSPLSGTAGTTNPNGTALFVQGVTGGVPLSVLFSAPQHVICDSGCGGGGGGSSYTVTYGTAIGTLGTPGGFKDASGNFQSFLGDTTAGQWVNIKGGSIANTVFGATQSGTWNVGLTGSPTVTVGNASIAITAATLPLPAGAATQTTLASILTAIGTPMQASGGTVGISGTLPAFAATPTVNIGTAPTITVTGSVTANAGTNLNTSLLALESGGNLASINTKTPALGQALAASSVPVVLTALQVTALTPPTTVAVTQGTGTNLHMVCDSGCSSSTSPSFGATFPLVGTPIGMSQGGLLVAMTGTSGNLNVQCANCSGSGVSTADGAAFTAGSSLFAGAGGIVQTTATSNPVTAGNQGLFQMTANRALFVNLRDAAGAILGATANPVIVAGAGTAGTPAGGVVSIQGVASGTVVPVSLTSTTITGTVAATQSGTWNIGTITTLPALVASSAIIGKVGIDQTTPGTTNLVSIGTTGTVNPTTAASWGINTLGSTTSGQSGQLALGAVTTGAPTYTTAQSNALSLTTAGALRVDGSSVTQPVSLTSTTISGSVSVTNAGTFAVQATLQASSATAIGTVNPTSIGNWGLAASTQNGGTPTNGHLVMGQFNTSPTTITSGNVSPFQLDSAGNLLVNVKAGGTGGGAVFGPTAVGSANANPPIVIGGTATGAAGQNVVGAAVKLASTASLATDTSLVTNESPNSQLSTTIGTTADAVYAGTGNAAVDGILKGIYAVASNGTATIGATAPGSAIYVGVNAPGGLIKAPTAVTPSGSIIATQMDIASIGGTAPANFGSAPGAVPAVPVNSNTQPTENHTGETGSNQISVSVAPTVTASAYSAGNAIGGVQTIAGAARVSGTNGASGTGGILSSMMLTVKSVQSTQVDVFIFNANPSSSTCTDKTAFVLATADAAKLIGVLSVPGTAANGAGWYSGGTGSLGMPAYYPLTYSLASATSIFACAVARGAFTPASTSDVAFNYNILRD